MWKLKFNLKAYLSTAALPGQTTKTAITEEFMFQNVAYRPTVYITGTKPHAQLITNINNSLILILLAPPSSIKMKLQGNSSQIFHNSLLTLKSGKKYLKVRCVVYDAKPAVKITWEYNGSKLDLKSNKAHCYDPTDPPLHDCIQEETRKSDTDDSLTDTSSTLTLKVGLEDFNKLRCLARHAASSSPQRVLVNIKKEKKGKIRMQQTFNKYCDILCITLYWTDSHLSQAEKRIQTAILVSALDKTRDPGVN